MDYTWMDYTFSFYFTDSPPSFLSSDSRYPRLLMELSVEVHRMRYDAYEMRPHRQLDRGVRLQINERTRPPGCQDGTRYSVEETNQFHGQAQEDERVGAFSLPRQITVSRLVYLRRKQRLNNLILLLRRSSGIWQGALLQTRYHVYSNKVNYREGRVDPFIDSHVMINGPGKLLLFTFKKETGFLC